MREETRRLILEAAHQLFAQTSVHGVRLEDIASGAGISRQAIYLHFATREELVRDLVQHMNRATGLPELLESFYSAPTGEAMLESLIDIQITIPQSAASAILLTPIAGAASWRRQLTRRSPTTAAPGAARS